MNRPGRAIARTVRGILLGTVLAAVPTVTYALGLGGLQVKSALNEPLNAEIDFTSISKKELQKLSVTLASRRDFDAAGVERPPYLADVKFALSKRLDGQPFVQLTSEQPIREPFLHFLVQVEWAGGRLVREFTALIDPPTLFAGAAPAVQVPEQAPLPTPITQPEAVPEPAPVIAAAAPAETLAPTPEPAASTPAVIEPLTAVAAMEPAVAEPARSVVPQPPPTADEPLGPPRLSDSSVAISAETGWPLASTGPAELATASDAPAVEPIVPAPLASAGPAMEPAAPASMAAPMPVAGGWANVTRYEVKRGDTLWAIAQKIRVDPTLSLEQVIMALYEVNRDAFFKNNVNNVWAGEVLLIPKREEVETLPTGQARQVFLAQYSEWQEYKLKLASASQTFKVAAAPEQSAVPAESSAGTPEASAQPEPATKPAEASAAPAAPKPEASKKAQPVDKPAKPEKTEPKPAPAPPTEQAVTAPKGAGAPVVAVRPKPPADLLKIVRAAIDSEAGAKGKVAEAEAGDTTQKERLALADRATTLDEAMQSKQLEQKEMQERIGTHQSQIEKQERLIELSNKDAVKTKEALTQAEPQAAAPVETTKGSVAKVPAEQAKPEETAKAAPPPKAKPVAPADKAATPAAKRRRVAPPPAAPAEEKGMFAQVQEMFGSYVMQAVAAIVALAGGFILLTYLRRRRAAEAEFEESILTDTDAMTEGGTTDSGGAQTTSSAASTSFLSDFSQGGMGNISTDEVDPLAETEVYLAYGRDEQAEEILKDAVAKDPKRHELKVKLLEIYGQRKDVAAFETLAEELYAAQAGRGGDLWNRVADMGRKLNPGNPMFQAVAPPDDPSLPMSIPSSRRAAPAAAASASDVLDFEPPTDRGGAGKAGSVPSFEVDTEDLKEASSGLDFELDLEGPEAKAKSVADGPVIPDTAELSAEELQAGQEDSLGLGDEPAENILDFDMGTEDRSGEEQEITADQPGEEPSWDAGAGAEAGLALETEAEASVSTDDAQQWDETATKLDLAKAYVDMGDAEGARSILDEVLAEGNDEQKRQAAELAAQIA